jgi:hypothetical protein
MSLGEMVGLALLAALIAGATGIVVGILLARRSSARNEHTRRVVDAYAAWLAARWSLNRAATSFVAAFRALGAERSDSPNHELRQQEAQRARSDWCAAVRTLECAQAQVDALSYESGDHRGVARNTPDAELLRTVIQGDSKAFAAFQERMRSEDVCAAQTARGAIAQAAARKPPFAVWRGLLAGAQRVLDRLSARE